MPKTDLNHLTFRPMEGDKVTTKQLHEMLGIDLNRRVMLDIYGRGTTFIRSIEVDKENNTIYLRDHQ